MYRSCSIANFFYDSERPQQYYVEGVGGGYGACAVACAKLPPAPPAEFNFELPRELFDAVLSYLPSSPDLFNAMAVNRYWREAASATYAHRTVSVPPVQDALLHAVANATPGDTLLLQPGMHLLTTELLIEKPLRLGATNAGGAAVLVTSCPSLLRTRAPVVLNGLTFCRMGEAEGHPNAVIVAESASLSVEHCRITCGGAAPTVQQALQAFDGAPPPGGNWHPAPPPLAALPSDEGATRQGPQSGVWVGSCASVTLRHNTIACCSGPGIKIYRGRLLAEHNTIAFSRCGANVVANSGRVVLTQNAIHGARGDGVSSWNNSHIALESNLIHSNRGTGITINTGGGSVSITRNRFAENTLTAVQFATSNVKKVTIGKGDQANDWTLNPAGGLQGLERRASFADLSGAQAGSSSALPAVLSGLPPVLPGFQGAGMVSIAREPSSPLARGSASSGDAMDAMDVDASSSGPRSSSGQSGWSVEMG